jgi:predicted acyltransferase
MNTTNKTNKTRILAIDIMRGLTLFLMLFVNDLYVPGVPEWLGHTKADFDGMGLADWVFPGFLFMVGLSIPYAINARRKKGDNTRKILLHVLGRSVSLLIIGVLMVNIGRLNPEMSGISKNIWAILVYVCIFLIWNQYKRAKLPKWVPWVLQMAGIAGLVGLVSIFRAGTAEDPGWIQPGWWGILGMIGWGYLTASLTYLLVRGNLLYASLAWIAFIGLNILSQAGMTSFLDFLKPVFSVIISGNTPSIVLAGLVAGIFLKESPMPVERKVWVYLILGAVALLSGYILRNWFIISKIYGTPSWAMICNGISLWVFALLLFTVDLKGQSRWANWFKIAGQNSLTTYLAPDILYYSIWMLSLPVFFYKQDTSQLLAVMGSVVWAFAMIGFANMLSKIHIHLKL